MSKYTITIRCDGMLLDVITDNRETLERTLIRLADLLRVHSGFLSVYEKIKARADERDNGFS